jgi:hypothetical protein
MGVLEYIPVKADDPFLGTEELQYIKMNECLQRVHEEKEQRGVRFVMFLDLDEFVYPLSPRTTLSQVPALGKGKK